MNRLVLTIKNDNSELTRLKNSIADFSRTHHLVEVSSHDVILAVDEMVANIIAYAYADNDEHDIEVEITLEDMRLKVTIIDEGRPFNPLDRPDPDIESPLEERPVGGLGIYLARNMMDTMEYQYVSNRNQLVMYKDLVNECI